MINESNFLQEVFLERDDVQSIDYTSMNKTIDSDGTEVFTCNVRALFIDLEPEENGWYDGEMTVEVSDGKVRDHYCNWSGPPQPMLKMR